MFGDCDRPQHRTAPEQECASPASARLPLEDLDYSTPEAQQALMWASELLLEIRREYVKPSARKIALYERTLGLAVVPVLLRRGAIILARKARRRLRGRQ